MAQGNALIFQGIPASLSHLCEAGLQQPPSLTCGMLVARRMPNRATIGPGSSLLFSTAGLHKFQLPPQPTQDFQGNEHRINHCILCEEKHRQLGLAAALQGSSQCLRRREVPWGHLHRSPSPSALVPQAALKPGRFLYKWN